MWLDWTGQLVVFPPPRLQLVYRDLNTELKGELSVLRALPNDISDDRSTFSNSMGCVFVWLFDGYQASTENGSSEIWIWNCTTGFLIGGEVLV
ncbi:hypothetical protein CEXT_33391 [Caerostris extrusa]|uniref:Uncharacterized protein n=1 Tax=Caerostris extrusa TaxID=172846 RepID=A0AAV4T6C9_CAEEX|nr:hypothetical protein CEXT_33391 [Caerostris extrusa]